MTGWTLDGGVWRRVEGERQALIWRIGGAWAYRVVDLHDPRPRRDCDGAGPDRAEVMARADAALAAALLAHPAR